MRSVKPYHDSPTGTFPKTLARRLICYWAFFALTADLSAASPVLSRLEVMGSGRGMALTLGADAAFEITVSEKPSEKPAASVLSIVCVNAIYGLDDYQFSSFPRGAPLRQITAIERGGCKGIEFLVKALIPFDKNIRFKQKDNRWVILLTSAPINDFAWSAQGETIKRDVADGGKANIIAENVRAATALAGPPRSTASSFLDDVTILHRERVETVIFKFDAPLEMIVKSAPERITVLFVNAKNGLPNAAFSSDKDWLVKSIELKEMIHGGATWLSASIEVNKDGRAKPLIRTFADKLVIYSVHDAKRSLSLWSAKNGATLSYDFITPREFKADLKNIENKARADSKDDMSDSGTFSVQPMAQNPPEPGTPPASPVTRIVIITDKTALRSRPSTAPPSAVIRRFPLGAIVTKLGKKGAWIRVKTDDAQGWVLGTLTMDSIKAPEALWRRIEAIKIAAANQDGQTTQAEKTEQVKIEKPQEAPATLPVKVAAPSTKPFDTAMKSAQPPVTATVAIAQDKPGQLSFSYQVYGRDPFLPLTQDEESPLPDVENLQMVGILYDKAARIALFEDMKDKNNAYALRENDPVRNGYLLRIQSDKVLFLIKEFGVSRTFVMKLNKEKQAKLFPDKDISNSMNPGETRSN